MDEERQPISHYIPGPGDEGGEDLPPIPHEPVNGWVKKTSWKGHEQLFQVRTVKVFENVMAKQLYPPPPKGHARYSDLFPQGDLETITEAEAHAWLRAHGLPIPGEEPAAPGDEAHE